MAFDLQESIESAALRFATADRRKRRADAGASRLDARVERELHRLLRQRERPAMREVIAALGKFCRRHRLRTPSRATIYNVIARVPPHSYAIARLPAHVRAALYNLDDHGAISGPQLAFHAFQHGDTRARSFAAGLPWIDLHHAERLRGWRPRSLGLLRAVLAARAIE